MRLSLLGYPYMQQAPNASNLAAAFRLDSTTERNAFKYYPNTVSAITEINLNLTIAGSPAGINWRVRVESDSADVPSGIVLGVQSAEFAVSSSGWTGFKALGTDTGDMTINQPVWIVLFYSSGSAPSGSDYIHMRHTTLNFDYHKIRHFNGSDWTAVGAQQSHAVAAVKHASTRIYGWGHDGSNTQNPPGSDIFSTHRAGLKFRVGAVFFLQGVHVEVVKTGTPADLVIQVYAGDTLYYDQTIPQDQVSTNAAHAWYFDEADQLTPLPADTDMYIVLKQAGNGGSDSADYRLRGHTIQSGLVETMQPTNWRFVQGDGDVPTALTADASHLPNLVPIYRNAEEDFDVTSLNDQWYNVSKGLGLEDLEALTLKALLVTSAYTFNPDHDFVDDVSAQEVTGSARVAVPALTTSIDNTGNVANGTLAATFIDFPTVTIGQTLGAMIVYIEGASDAARQLVLHCRIGAVGGSIVSDGTDVRVNVADAGILVRAA